MFLLLDPPVGVLQRRPCSVSLAPKPEGAGMFKKLFKERKRSHQNTKGSEDASHAKTMRFLGGHGPEKATKSSPHIIYIFLGSKKSRYRRHPQKNKRNQQHGRFGVFFLTGFLGTARSSEKPRSREVYRSIQRSIEEATPKGWRLLKSMSWSLRWSQG